MIRKLKQLKDWLTFRIYFYYVKFFKPKINVSEGDIEEFNKLFESLNEKLDEQIQKLNQQRNKNNPMENMFGDNSSMFESEEELTRKYGPPKEEKIFDGVLSITYTRKTWKTPVSFIVRIIMNEGTIQPKEETQILSLDEQLKLAIEEENFELAAILRDKIKENVN